MISQIPDTPAILSLLSGADQLTLGCHVNPDGDAVGSMLGFAEAARAQGKAVEASFFPFPLAPQFQFLPQASLRPPDQLTPNPTVFVSFDSGSLDRLGPLAPVAQQAEDLVVIDHHATNPGFGTRNLVLSTAAATTEIVFHLLSALGWPLDPIIATCLHTGLVTDTGRFQYSSTSAQTFRVAAALVEAGADLDTIGQECYDKVPRGYLQVLAGVLNRLQLDPPRRLVWSSVGPDDLSSAGIGWEETDQLIDTIRLAQESEVAVLFKHTQPGQLKLSIRSRGEINVGELAQLLGGGGHHNAAGASFSGTPTQALELINGYLDGITAGRG